MQWTRLLYPWLDADAMAWASSEGNALGTEYCLLERAYLDVRIL